MRSFQFSINGIIYCIIEISYYAARQKLNEDLGLG